ncbi:hypothetical protein CEXT_810801, partial [Caerostris extrusa]
MAFAETASKELSIMPSGTADWVCAGLWKNDTVRKPQAPPRCYHKFLALLVEVRDTVITRMRRGFMRPNTVSYEYRLL